MPTGDIVMGVNSRSEMNDTKQQLVTRTISEDKCTECHALLIKKMEKHHKETTPYQHRRNNRQLLTVIDD